MSYHTILKCSLLAKHELNDDFDNQYLLVQNPEESSNMDIDILGDMAFNEEFTVDNAIEVATVNNVAELEAFIKENDLGIVLDKCDKGIKVGGGKDYILDNNLEPLGWEEELNESVKDDFAEIYQMKSDDSTYGKRFMPLSSIEDLRLDDYEKVAEVKLVGKDDNEILEKIFTEGNTNQNFRDVNPKMRSISVSDLVKLHNRYYYCDSIGWKDVTDMVSKSKTENKKLENNSSEDFTAYIDKEGIKYANISSLCFENGETIASYTKNGYTLDLICNGSTEITDLENDRTYTHWGEFPDELKQLILDGADLYDNDKWYMGMNNWFEYILTDANGDEECSEVADIEGRINNMSDLENIMKEAFEDFTSHLKTEGRTIKTEDRELLVEEEDTNTEQLNSGLVNILDVGLYGWEILDLYDFGSYSDLDHIIMDIATPRIEEVIQTALPSATLKATGVYHPKYYNFETDELEFDITYNEAEYEKLKEATIANEDFAKFLNKYKSYDGFVSYTADNLDDFGKQEEWRQLAQVIQFNIVVPDYLQEDYWCDFIQAVASEFPAIEDEVRDDVTDYEARVMKDVTDKTKMAYNKIKDALDGDSDKVDVNGFYFPSEAVELIGNSDTSYHLNSYMDLTTSNILNTVAENDTIESAIHSFFEEYKADSAYSWADNFVTILNRI